jgi:predicted RNase H-like HicB family nuclease
MASTTRDPDGLEGVEFVRDDDGTITARDLETGLARGGDTRAEALAQLAEALELHEGGKPIDDPDEFLEEELGIDPDDVDEKELPDFLR